MTATSALPTCSSTVDVRECSACPQPLGSASRYCLHCGARQGPADLQLVGLGSPAGATASPASPAGPAAPAVPAPAPATVLPTALPGAAAGRGWPFALTAVVLLALVIGLLAGGWLADRRDGPGSPAGTGVPAATPASAGVAPAPVSTVSAPASTAPATAPADGPVTGAGE